MYRKTTRLAAILVASVAFAGAASAGTVGFGGSKSSHSVFTGHFFGGGSLAGHSFGGRGHSFGPTTWFGGHKHTGRTGGSTPTHQTPSVPVPAGLPLVLTGLGALALVRKRRKA